MNYHTETGYRRADAHAYIEKAKIANLFIRAGSDYIRSSSPTMMTLSHERTIKEALDLSEFLLGTFPAAKDKNS